MIATAILLMERYEQISHIHVLLLPLSVLLSVLMVSNIRYPSFKKLNMRAIHFTRFLIGVIVLALMVFVYPIEGMALLGAMYLLYGPLRATYYLIRRMVG
jgi:CDP-diacylglycerol--serine O-phosphatidyltransferase